METKINDTIDFLDELLDEERAALLDGNLEHIARLTERKETLIDTLNEQEASGFDHFAELHEKIERNQLLLNSALDGIQSVARRLATMRRIRNSLDTYDAQGRRKEIEMHPDRAVEKRA